MTLAATFSNALSGLGAANLRAELLSFNIANAATPGFARRDLSLETSVPGGVRAVAVNVASGGRSESALLDAETRSNGASLRAEALATLNAAFGEAGDDDGLYAVFSRFEQRLEDLRLSPESGAAQLAFLDAAKDVASTFQALDTRAQDLRLEADRAIAEGVGRVNDALAQLRQLNAEAARPRGASVDTVAERQRTLVTEIARELDIEVDGQFGEVLTIRTRGGFQLLGARAAELGFAPAGFASFELSLAAGDFSGLSVDGRDVTPGSVQGIAEGRLAANFAIRDALAPDFAARLDAAATELVERLEGADLTAADGLFVLGAGTSSAARRITVNPLVDPAAGGELFRLRDGIGAPVPGPSASDGVLGALKAGLKEARPLPAATGQPNAFSFLDTLGAMASQIGVEALRADGIRATAEDAVGVIGDEVRRATGVDTDRELQDLLIVEQAFAANARVIQAADAMLAQLLEI